MASLSEKKDYWRITFTDSTRIPKRKDVYFKKEDYGARQIKEVQRELEYDFKRGKYNPWNPVKEDGISLKQAVELFKAKDKKRLAPSTFNNRVIMLDALLRREANMELVGLDPRYWNDYVNEPKKYQSREARRTIIKGVYNRLKREGYDVKLDIEILARASEKNQADFLTTSDWMSEKEMELLIKGIPILERNRTLDEDGKKKKYSGKRSIAYMEDVIRLGFYTGLRQGDLFALKGSWIREDNKVIYVGESFEKIKHLPKNQLPQDVVPVLPQARPILSKLRGKPNERLLPHSPKRAYVNLKDLVALQLPHKPNLTFHSLRHSFVMYCMDVLKLRERTVKQLTRHKDDRSLAKYTHHNVDAVLDEIDVPT